MKKKSYKSLRWILLAGGIIAILGLTGMNVYSLYKLRDSAIEADKNNLKLRINEFTDRIRYRFTGALDRLPYTTEMAHLEEVYRTKGQFPSEAMKKLENIGQDSIFTGIYFQLADNYACRDNQPLSKYNPDAQQFEKISDNPPVVCDGIGITRTRMNALVDSYQYNNKIIFDSHRSMTTALVDVPNHRVIGYLTMPINRDYLVNDFLQAFLQRWFRDRQNSDLVVWVRDWTRGEILASSDTTMTREEFTSRIYAQRFPNLFDEWQVEGTFSKNSVVSASNASLIKNLIVLGAALLLLIGAFAFMFITAQRERALARRQAGFLANVTHELKTPLAVMQAAGENLADGRVKDTKRLKSYGNHIYSESVRLRSMIEKLLDVAKADAGQSIIEAQPVYLNQLVQAWIDDHESFLDNKGFTLETTIPDKMPLAMIDPDSLNTILGNLVENSIKYSNEEKYIHINMEHDGENIKLEIEDQGVGIPKHSLKHIFEKFYRVEETLTAETKGHGLGLSIVQNLVDLNGGSIDVKSNEGEGATFTLTFPIFLESNLETKSQETIQAPSLTQDSPKYVG